MDKKDNVIQCGLCYKWLKNKKKIIRDINVKFIMQIERNGIVPK